MKTADAARRFLEKCRERGLSEETVKTYFARLRHFATAHPELPLGTNKIEAYLKQRGETPARRGKAFNVLQAFYSYLEQFEDIPSPVPARGQRGRPRRVSAQDKVSAQVQAEVQAALAAQGITPQGAGGQDFSMATAEAVQKFTDSRKAQGIGKVTQEKYHTVFTPFKARYPELPLTPEPIEAFIRSIKGRPITRWTYQSTLKALYNFLEKRYRAPNPMRSIPPVKVPRKVRPTLELDQLRELIALDLSPRDRAIVTLLMDCGLRAGELSSLTREHVHPDHIVVDGKTGQHSIPISRDTYELLIMLAPSGLLFRTSKGPMSRKALWELIGELLDRIGYTGEKRGPHMLRHSYGRHYMALGGDLMSLKEVLGHTKVETTQLYAELAFEDVKQLHSRHSPLGKLNGGKDVHPESESQE